MVYLDVKPVIESLRTVPEDFRLKGKWLSHRRSHHDFGFNPDGTVLIRAACACSNYQVMPEQERALYNSFREWEAGYWHPLTVNRQFASHFRHYPSWRRALIRMATRLASWLAEEGSLAESADTEKLHASPG